MGDKIIIKKSLYDYTFAAPATIEVKPHKPRQPIIKSKPIQMRIIHENLQDDKTTPVFLYLQPTNIAYEVEDLDDTSYEIELHHNRRTITKLTESQPHDTLIDLSTFHLQKPSFSMTIFQDNVSDITALSDTPLSLTLYEYTTITKSSPNLHQAASATSNIKSMKSLTRKKSGTTSLGPRPSATSIKVVKKVPKAQGYIDLLQFFLKNRSTTTMDVFLHPLKQDGDNYISCKMTWDIYSLMPLLKQVHFSNAIFIAFTSIYNTQDDLMANANQLIANISFQPRVVNKKASGSEKIFICCYRGFVKKIISEQNLYYKWESLKDHRLGDFDGIGISADVNINLHRLFAKLMYPEKSHINIRDINPRHDYALICNSIHRFILTDKMHRKLEEFLCNENYHLVVDILKASDPGTILLQGTLDPSIFMYPHIQTCAFAVELKSLTKRTPATPPPSLRDSASLRTVRNTSNERMSPTPSKMEKINQQDAIPFAIIKICLKVPITEPPEDLNLNYNLDQMRQQIYTKCQLPSEKKRSSFKQQNCEEYYVLFEDGIYQMAHNISKHHIYQMAGNEEYLCTQVQNMINLILPLVACDFNKRYKTKTNREFVNLMTTVYKELTHRVYDLIMDADNMWSMSRVTYMEMQLDILNRMNIAKYLLECGNYTESLYVMEQLDKRYNHNPMYTFYKFLDNIERGDYDAAGEYLKGPVAEQELEAQRFTALITIYLDYMKDLIGTNETAKSAMGNLLVALTNYCEKTHRTCQTGWMLLYCAYKKFNYRPGMSYARWNFDNLITNSFIDITHIPISRWDMYNKFSPKLQNDRDVYLWRVITLLLNLGLYHFAEWLFKEVADRLSEIEKYILRTSFIFHLKKLKSDFEMKTFENVNNPEVEGTVLLVNGHIEYLFNDYGPEALKSYKGILSITNLADVLPYQIGVLRYGYYMMQSGEYEKALYAFEFASNAEGQHIITLPAIGVALYCLGRLEEAEKYFSECTHYSICMPKVWAYLALINLKTGDNYKALECWKYYRLNPDDEIADDILTELAKIDYDRINLHMNYPN